MRAPSAPVIQVVPPEVLLQAYAQGYFPMGDGPDGRIQWYTADPRALLPLRPFHVPRRLQRSLRKRGFTFTHDQDFERTIRACAERDSTWISESIVQTYLALHRAGFAHSVEAWSQGELAGGLYGVHLGGAFFGESMFNRVPDASKAALVHLAGHLAAQGFRLLEIQMITSLTEQFGARPIPRAEYLPLLAEALSMDCEW